MRAATGHDSITQFLKKKQGGKTVKNSWHRIQIAGSRTHSLSAQLCSVETSVKEMKSTVATHQNDRRYLQKKIFEDLKNVSTQGLLKKNKMVLCLLPHHPHAPDFAELEYRTDWTSWKDMQNSIYVHRVKKKNLSRQTHPCSITATRKFENFLE